MTQGERIRAARKRAGKSLRDVGNTIGVSCTYVSDVERSMRSVNAARLQQIADYLGVHVDEFGPATCLGRAMSTWLRTRPDVVSVLAEAMRTGRTVVLGDEP